MIADGNFVLTLSEGERNKTAYGFYDLLRLEGGADRLALGLTPHRAILDAKRAAIF